MAVVFITGPVRSGKSAYAVRLASESGRDVSYLATAAADPEDAEWRARLARHTRDRPPSWRTLETAGLTLDAQLAIFRDAAPTDCLLVDALGTWLAAGIGGRVELLEIDYLVFEAQLDREAAALVDAMAASPALVLAVGEQVGWDVVPVAASARLFRDVMGRMAQRLAARAERAYLVVAGYALDLRANGVAVGGDDSR